MKYRAIINIDFTKPDTNEYTKLKRALCQSSWLLVETSAFVIETDDIGAVWMGIELVAKQASAAGDLSALTFHVQAAEDFGRSLPIKSTLSPAEAQRDILRKTFPKPSGEGQER